MIHFTVPAIPIAQPRQRHRVIAAAGRQFVHNYTPTKSPVNAFKASVAAAAAAAYSGPPLAGPLSLSVVFVLPRPGNMIWKRRPMPRAWHAKKPDRDNLEKSLKDALSGRLWRDDAQVCSGNVEKWIAAGDEQPHVEVTVTTLEDSPTPAPAGETENP